MITSGIVRIRVGVLGLGVATTVHGAFERVVSPIRRVQILYIRSLEPRTRGMAGDALELIVFQAAGPLIGDTSAEVDNKSLTQ